MRFLFQCMSLSAISLHFPAGLKLSMGQFAGWELSLPAGLALYIFGVTAFFVTASLPSVQLACWHSAAPTAGCPGVPPLCPLCPAWGACSSMSCSSLCALRGCGGLAKEPDLAAGGSGWAGDTLAAPGGARCWSRARGGSVLFAGLFAELSFSSFSPHSQLPCCEFLTRIVAWKELSNAAGPAWRSRRERHSPGAGGLGNSSRSCPSPAGGRCLVSLWGFLWENCLLTSPALYVGVQMKVSDEFSSFLTLASCRGLAVAFAVSVTLNEAGLSLLIHFLSRVLLWRAVRAASETFCVGLLRAF